MAGRSEYRDQDCSLARTLEVVGERWTLLVIRDAFYGVQAFGDFVEHLGLPRAVLSDRLSTLVEAGVLDKAGRGRGTTYVLTEKGRSLWPAVLTLMSWGSEHYDDHGPNRLFVHVVDEGRIEAPSRCRTCGTHVDAGDIEVRPGPGLVPGQQPGDRVSSALAGPHRLLEPIGATEQEPGPSTPAATATSE